MICDKHGNYITRFFSVNSDYLIQRDRCEYCKKWIDETTYNEDYT